VAKSVVRNYLAFQFFFSLLFWFPVFYEYQKQVGLNDVQIFGIQSIYYFAFCLLELPTGYLADRFGALLCMRTGSALQVVTNLIPIFFPTYVGFLSAMILVALSRSLISGAASAYLYESLSLEGQTALYKNAEGRARSYSLLGKVAVWPFAGLLMKLQFNLPYVLTAGASLFAFAISWQFKPLKILPDLIGNRTTSFVKSLIPAARGILKSPLLILVVLQGILIFVFERTVQVNLFQPLLGSRGFAVTSYGLILAITTVFEAGGSAYPEYWSEWITRIFKSITPMGMVAILGVILSMSVFVITWSGPIGCVIGLSFFALAIGFTYPSQRQLMNSLVPDSRFRATVLSIESLLDRAACAVLTLSIGAVVAHGQIDGFLRLIAIFGAMGIGILFLWFRKLRLG